MWHPVNVKKENGARQESKVFYSIKYDRSIEWFQLCVCVFILKAHHVSNGLFMRKFQPFTETGSQSIRSVDALQAPIL